MHIVFIIWRKLCIVLVSKVHIRNSYCGKYQGCLMNKNLRLPWKKYDMEYVEWLLWTVSPIYWVEAFFLRWQFIHLTLIRRNCWMHDYWKHERYLFLVCQNLCEGIWCTSSLNIHQKLDMKHILLFRMLHISKIQSKIDHAVINSREV